MKEPFRPFDLLPFLAGWLLAALGMVSAFLPIITAFALPVKTDALFFVGILIAGYIAAAFSLNRGKKRLVLLLLAAWLYVLIAHWKAVSYGGAVTAYEILYQIAVAAGQSVEQLFFTEFLTASEIAAHTTVFFAVLSVPVLLLYGWSIVSLGSVAPCIVLSVPLFALTMICIDSPPSFLSVVLTILFWMLLVLPQRVRRVSKHRGAVLTFVYLPILGTLAAVLLLASPRTTYVRAAWPDVLRETLADFREDGFTLSRESVEETVEQVTALNPSTDIDVKNLGPRRPTGAIVFEVTDSRGGLCYLRGSALGRYDGKAWRAVEAPEMIDSPDAALGERLAASGNVETLTVEHPIGNASVCYTPYYAVKGDAVFCESYAAPTEKSGRYAWQYVPLDAPPAAVSTEAELAYRTWASKAYTDLPETLKSALLTIAKENGIDASLSREAIASRVADYVRSAAVYDLQTPRAPTDADFILHFLTESRRGYCMHFASAATAMLQALDVPARFVSGYMTNTQADATVTVTDEAAHAWVEVYFDGIGWIPYEVTGSGTEADPPTVEASAEPFATPTLEPTVTPEPTDALPPISTEAPHLVTPAPNDEAPTVDTPPERTDDRGRAWLLLLLFPIGVLLLVLRYRRLLARREARLKTRDDSRRIVEAWRQLEALKPYGAKLPEPLLHLAEEARFSDHVFDEARAKPITDHLLAERARLNDTLPLWRKWVAKYLRVVL